VTDPVPYPFGYFLSLCRHAEEPPFESAAEQLTYWGREWGAVDEVGQLRTVLMRRPRDEWAIVDTRRWDDRAQALVDPDGLWYWESRDAPDLERVRAEHAGLEAALGAEGVEIVHVEGYEARHVRAIYTRDPLVTVRGGAIVGRLAPVMRKGEERHVTATLAALGMPILRTIHGTGMMEGGSFVKLTPQVAAFGTSIRCNADGAEQLREVLRWQGVELIVVPMAGWSIHLDGHLGMVDVDKALVDPNGLPHWFLDRLAALGIEPIYCAPGEEWAINALCVRPGRIVMCDSCPRTAETLERRGVEVIAVPYDEVQKGGGGVHCSTMELVREPAA
jgi:N-dimethylarginine dimethylaminohydrolase